MDFQKLSKKVFAIKLFRHVGLHFQSTLKVKNKWSLKRFENEVPINIHPDGTS